MIEIINSKSAVNYLENYYNALKRMGYVKKPVMYRYLAYAFLVDYVDTLYYFLSEKDYCKIEEAMLSIFRNADCLLTYSNFCLQKAKIGNPYASVTLRGIETRANLRATETNNLRKV